MCGGLRRPSSVYVRRKEQRRADANGIYYFSDIPAGTYFVASLCNPFQQPFPTCSAPNRGGDDTLDSDFDGPGHRTPDFALPADGSIGHFDAGFANFID